MVGWVFFWECVIKFVFVNQGVGRFTKLGMPMPEVLAPAIETDLWTNRTYAFANVVSVLFGAGLYASLLLGVLFLTEVWASAEEHERARQSSRVAAWAAGMPSLVAGPPEVTPLLIQGAKGL